jgi:hypothetical protein
MKREEIKKIFPEATDEQLNSIMEINGADVEKVKAKLTATEAELKEKKEAFDNLNTELDNLKESNASAEDWKVKFEALQAENIAKERQAEVDRIAKEKSDNILSRFNGVVGDKKFTHEAVKADYLKKFGDALESKDYEGKSDEDIFRALTKDDASAFVGIQTVQLVGGNQHSTQGNEPKPLPKIF